jgi:hypothetical protein
MLGDDNAEVNDGEDYAFPLSRRFRSMFLDRAQWAQRTEDRSIMWRQRREPRS